jgi:hypothetical protein
MRVRAIGSSAKWAGYYGNIRRRAGDVFTLTNPAHFSAVWMEKVEETVAESKPVSLKKFNSSTMGADNV